MPIQVQVLSLFPSSAPLLLVPQLRPLYCPSLELECHVIILILSHSTKKNLLLLCYTRPLHSGWCGWQLRGRQQFRCKSRRAASIDSMGFLPGEYSTTPLLIRSLRSLPCRERAESVFMSPHTCHVPTQPVKRPLAVANHSSSSAAPVAHLTLRHHPRVLKTRRIRC